MSEILCNFARKFAKLEYNNGKRIKRFNEKS